MNRKMHWGIAALIILLIAAGGFIYWQWSSVQQFKEELAQEAKELEEDNQQKQPPIDYTKPPPGKTFANGGHWHNGEWHDAPHEPIAQPKAGKFPDWNSLTPEQQQQIFDQFYVQFGLKVPPRGYDYDWKEPGVPYLDENGNPVLRRLDEPIVRIEMGIGFAPTLEEFERWNKLYDDQGWAEARGDVAEAARLKAEMDALEASAQRMRPLSVSSTWSTAEAKSKSRRFAKEKFSAALREHGLGHLISPWD